MRGMIDRQTPLIPPCVSIHSPPNMQHQPACWQGMTNRTHVCALCICVSVCVSPAQYARAHPAATQLPCWWRREAIWKVERGGGTGLCDSAASPAFLSGMLHMYCVQPLARATNTLLFMFALVNVQDGRYSVAHSGTLKVVAIFFLLSDTPLLPLLFYL